jgi:hypothetical protein
MLRGFYVGCLLLLLSAFLYSQATQPPAVVVFTLDFPGSEPEHYSLQVQSDGKSRYESSGKALPESDQVDSFDYSFTVSPSTQARIFELSAKAGYFQKDLDSHRKNMAFTGRKTLSYKDERRTGQSTYNYSPDVAVQDLTNLFQGLSATLELGHRLEYSLRYQKLARATESSHRNAGDCSNSATDRGRFVGDERDPGASAAFAGAAVRPLSAPYFSSPTAVERRASRASGLEIA